MANPSPNMFGLPSSGSGRRACGWLEHEIDAWVFQRVKGYPWTPVPPAEHPKILRKKEVLARVGLSHVRIWQLEREGKFPKRFALTDSTGLGGPASRSSA